MTTLDVLGPDATSAIAELCERSLDAPPAADEIAGALFAPDEPSIVRGDPTVGVVASGTSGRDGYVRLIVVDPAHRQQGHGAALLDAAEKDLTDAGATSVTVGADAPYFLFPGVETTEIGLLALLEGRYYERREANFNMPVDLTAIEDDPGGHTVATPAERDEVDEWMAANWGNWRLEVLRALDKGTLLIARDDQGISAFCAYDVNRRGLLGPVASRMDLLGKRASQALILGALHRMKAQGRTTAEVVWVGPIVPYARLGATVGRVFFVYKRRLP